MDLGDIGVIYSTKFYGYVAPPLLQRGPTVHMIKSKIMQKRSSCRERAALRSEARNGLLASLYPAMPRCWIEGGNDASNMKMKGCNATEMQGH